MTYKQAIAALDEIQSLLLKDSVEIPSSIADLYEVLEENKNAREED